MSSAPSGTCAHRMNWFCIEEWPVFFGVEEITKILKELYSLDGIQATFHIFFLTCRSWFTLTELRFIQRACNPLPTIFVRLYWVTVCKTRDAYIRHSRAPVYSLISRAFSMTYTPMKPRYQASRLRQHLAGLKWVGLQYWCAHSVALRMITDQSDS